jgi:hypothetical protein
MNSPTSPSSVRRASAIGSRNAWTSTTGCVIGVAIDSTVVQMPSAIGRPDAFVRDYDGHATGATKAAL